MSDPNTQSTQDPQDIIDQALGNPAAMPNSSTPTSNPSTSPTPPSTPTLPPLEPLGSTVDNTTPVVTPPTEPVPNVVPTEPTPVSQPAEPVAPAAPVSPELGSAPSVQGEDVPLAFMGGTAADMTTPASVEPTVAPIMNDQAVVPPVMTTPLPEPPKKKSPAKAIVNLVIGLFVAFGLMSGVGLYAYQTYGTVNPSTIAKVSTMDQDSCNGCSADVDGGWLVWRDGACKVSGICNSSRDGKDTQDPNIDSSNNATDCQQVGGFWCTGNDSNGSAYAFCGSNTTGKACYQQAIDKGYTFTIGNVSCKKQGDTWVPDGNYNIGENVNSSNPNDQGSIGAIATTNPDDLKIYGDVMSVYEQVDKQCKAQSGSFTATGTKEMWICPKGTTVACTSNVPGAKRFYGNATGCFCGVIQVDTGSGHQSYSSTCGCDEEIETNNPTHKVCDTTTYQCKTVAGSGVDSCSGDADCMPTIMCTGLTTTPSTTPKIGDALTFSCSGASVPAGAVKLTYEYRYQVDSGAWKSMITDKSTTPKGTLTVAACGSYRVQCRVCGTINGSAVCDPTWVGATQQ